MSKVEEKEQDITNDKNKLKLNKEEIVKEENAQKIISNEESIEEVNDKDVENDEVATILEQEKVIENSQSDVESKQNDIEDKKANIKSDGLHKYTIAISIISVLLFVALVVFSTAFGLINRTSNKIVSGVSIKGIDISGLTYDEAQEKITTICDNRIKQNITLKHNDYETVVTPEQIETNFGIKEALDMAYSIGRSGKVLKDNYAIINASINNIDINPSFSYNDEALINFINETSENLPDTVEQSGYWIEGNNLIISKGKSGAVIKTEELKNRILNNIVNLNTELQEIEIPVETKEPDKVDIEKIHSEIYKEAKDAYYTKDPFTIYPHVVGVDFNISLDEVKALVDNDQNEITVPLKTTMPNITTNQIGTEAFPNLLATFSTTFSTANTNRATNIRLASNKINGVVLLPGQQFSYNTVVGKRTAGAGYKMAGVYVNGKVSQDIGGGICQVSSTLYNTALRANLEIVKRSNHRFATGYVPLSTDATVSWGGPEFIFKNSRKYPIKIVSTVNGGRIKVDIYGCKEETEYEVIIQSETLRNNPNENRV